MADLDSFRTFVTAVRSGSFAAAASALAVTPAMVGRRIQGLERRYGVRLIERTTRSQRLTDAGEAFLIRVEALLDASAELDNAMSAGPGHLEGRIRMTGPATLGVSHLASILARFSDAHSAVTLEMVLSDRRLDLVTEGFDFAVRVAELPNSTMISRHVGTYRLALVAAPAYVEKYGLPRLPKDLSDARCLINLNISPRNRWPFFRNGRRETAEITGGLQIDQDAALRSAAVQGAGIAYLPVDLVALDIAEGRLVRLLPDWDTMSLPINIVYPSRRTPQRVSALMEFIARELRHSHTPV